jgi:hypothetical protein
MENKWTYLLVYSPAVADYPKVRKFLDETPSILNWFVCIPNTAIIVSDETALSLTERFRKRFSKGRFLILDTKTDRNGYLPKTAWDLMQRPEKVIDE